MAILLFSLIILSALHFYFQNVIMPVWMLESKLKFIDLKKRIIKVKQKSGISFNSAKTFTELIDSTIFIIDNREGMDIFMLNIYKIKSSPDRKDFLTHIKTVQHSKNVEIKEINSEYLKLLKGVLTANSYAWGFYILPIVLWRTLNKFFTKQTKNYSNVLLSSIWSFQQNFSLK